MVESAENKCITKRSNKNVPHTQITFTSGHKGEDSFKNILPTTKNPTKKETVAVSFLFAKFKLNINVLNITKYQSLKYAGIKLMPKAFFPVRI